ncbi:MAG: inorganic pyrophosphatase/exopolyphosphatase [Cognaticolwellia sp.]|jgi:inorganic pyrophosphatase/exopolyphosphatase
MTTSVRIVTTLLLLVSSSSCLATTNQDLDDELSQRCLSTFDFVKKQDLAAFMAQMPPEHTKGQEKRLKKILERAHKRRFGNGDIKSIDITNVTYKDINKNKQEGFGELEQAKVKLLITSSSRESHVSCKFMRTTEGWFLSSLP